MPRSKPDLKPLVDLIVQTEPCKLLGHSFDRIWATSSDKDGHRNPCWEDCTLICSRCGEVRPNVFTRRTS